MLFSNHLCFFSLNKAAASMCWISTYSLLLQTVNLHSTYGPRSRKMHTWWQKPVFCLLKVEYSDKTLFIGLKFRPTIDRNRTRNMHNVYSTIKWELCRQKKLASGKNRILHTTFHVIFKRHNRVMWPRKRWRINTNEYFTEIS